ncbi:MAG: PQQ-binding-like beta-propeller repeat protein, partial [Planctomycetota bacterium]|nr:PQQ-binding-like beta-propeller repeat protein [Planctomycetota bacterium]
TQFVVALECATGKIRWKRDRALEPDRGFSFCTPLLVKIDGEPQLISSGSDAVFGLSPKTGEEIWRVRYKGGYSVVPRPVFGHDMVYVCTGFNTPVLLAIRVPGAKGDVTETHVAWKLTKKVPLDPSPLVVGDDLYLVSDDGILTC